MQLAVYTSVWTQRVQHSLYTHILTHVQCIDLTALSTDRDVCDLFTNTIN